MKDSEFKQFKHILPNGYHINTNGTNIVKGYAPDISINNPEGVVSIILESERKSERKAFIGAMIKASKYAEDSQNILTLIFVMKETGNQTTVAQVSKNLEEYYLWITSLGASKLQKLCFISHPSYIESANKNECILSDDFLARCVVYDA